MEIKHPLIIGKRVLFSLRFSVNTIFITLFILIAIFVTIFTMVRLSKVLLVVSENLMTTTTNSIRHELYTLLDPIVTASNLSARMIKDKTIDPANFNEMIEYTNDLLRILPQAQEAYWGDEQGSFVISRHQPDNTVLTEYRDNTQSPQSHMLIFHDANGRVIAQKQIYNSDYDPRLRPWYSIARQAKRTIWTSVYFFYFEKLLGITCAVPIYQNNHLQGVFAIDIKLDSISDFLAAHKISENGAAVIVDHEGNVIAYPHLAALFNASDTKKLININSLANPSLAKAFDDFRIKQHSKFILDVEHIRYLAAFTKISIFEPYHWYIGIVVPENYFVGQLKHYNRIVRLILCLLALLALYCITLFAKRISKPVNQLARELEKIKLFHIEPSPPIKTRITEVYTMANAVESMKVGLRSFQKYVPDNLVRQLIYSDEAAKIGGTNRKVALFFSDIVNFTTIAEHMGTEEVMQHLCEYFDELTQIILLHQGTVDKFIGDSIMAFWGAPLMDEDSVAHACIAALKCQARIAALNQHWRQTGQIPLPTRMGIHFGEVVVGNLGSTERLSYTAIGDSVNIASRLEQLNKIYGTKIIVSEQVRNQIAGRFFFRILDRISLKGQKEAFCIYELIQEDQKTIEPKWREFYQHYSQGFNAYQQQDWDQACSYFEEALRININDVASKIMIARCHSFKKNPPSKQWNGIWRREML